MGCGVGRGPLDGMVFVGKIGPEGNPDKYDELHFSEGQFWSWQCTKCGFEPGNYWVRTVGDSLHFQGWLHSADRGKFQYAGRVVDGRIEVTINWTKKR